MAEPASPSGSVVVAEGKDFATQVLRDPWDMDSLGDVSIYLNRSGQSYDTRNISVSGGVFSAVSNSGDTHFSPLFPGYEDMIKSANMGALQPINSATYRCLYTAMRIDEQQSDSQAQLLWFKDAALNSGDWAQSGGYWTVDNQWLLYSWQLDAIGGSPDSWNSSSTWQGLRIDPTQYANTPYEVDWVRLTDCAAVNTTVNWSPGNDVDSIRLRPQGTTRDILVKSDFNDDGSETLDVQGIQPGTYTVRLFNTAGSFVTNANVDTLIVNQAPIAHFVTPSFISGADYATAAGGNAWDFAAGDDVEAHYNNITSITNNMLEVITDPGPLPAGSDSQVFLNTPVDFVSGQYRYLSIRMNTQWDWPSPNYPWPNMPDGMVMRWIWAIPGWSGPTYRCHLVSQDIPFDIGWRTYTIDLFDSYNGSPEEKAGECPGTAPSWAASGTIKELRLDPNENVTGRDPISNGGTFRQQIDWIKLTAMERVDGGIPYLVQVDLNRPAGDVDDVDYFYTTSLSNPTQHPAQQWSAPSPTGQYRVRLPIAAFKAGATGGADTLPQADMSFWWNTSSVPNGTYYLCARITITPNTATYCSAAPIQVY